MKKLISSLLVAMMLGLSLSACGGGDAGTAEAPADAGAGTEATETADEGGEEAAAEEAGDKEIVTFWYAYKNEEATAFENIIASYNASQDKYFVDGLSVTDQQKLIVALSSNEAPDAFTLSNQDVITYQSNGLMENLQDWVTSTGFDTSIYLPKALEANSVDGDAYALPFTAYTIQMFYNVDLLKELGYDEPPATWEELYDIALEATVVDDDGNIETLGYPLFPLASARQELIYGFGGRWWDENGNPTPDDPAILDSLNMNVKFRDQYGIEKVQAFVATANTNRYTEQDMFFVGKQLFRLDGPWLPTMMAENNSDVNWGVALIPGTEANPDALGTSRFEASSVGIPITAANKEGAWDFITWMTGTEEGAKELVLSIGNPPALLSLFDDADVLAVPSFPEFIEAGELGKGIQYAQISDFAKYVSLIEEHLDYVYNGMMSPEDAMESLTQQSAGL